MVHSVSGWVKLGIVGYSWVGGRGAASVEKEKWKKKKVRKSMLKKTKTHTHDDSKIILTADAEDAEDAAEGKML